jgi:prepilin-type N-terminal cleavage/methylation domain-containing protein
MCTGDLKSYLVNDIISVRMSRTSRNYKSGFSLIELLVVISIIGILVSILILNFDEARKNSRDKVRKSELKSLQLAIETYKSQNGVYPSQSSANCAVVDGATWTGPGPQPAWATNCSDYIAGLVPDYISALPTDPNQEQDSGKGFIYMTDATHSSYKVMVHKSVEGQFVTSFGDEFSRCPSSCTSCPTVAANQDVYAVYSHGAECW